MIRYKLFNKLKTDAKYTGKRLKCVIETNWSGHLDAICPIVYNWNEVIEALDIITESEYEFEGETILTAEGIRKKMKEDKFIVCALIIGGLKPAERAL